MLAMVSHEDFVFGLELLLDAFERLLSATHVEPRA
jgi:hypothetical protein